MDVMEKIPGFNSFKSSWVERWSQIKVAFMKKEWGWLIAYLFRSFFIIVGIAGLFFGGVTSFIVNWHTMFPPQIVSHIPPRTINYFFESPPTKDVDGLYRATFDLEVNVPAGNNQQTWSIVPNVPQSDCALTGYRPPLVECSGGLASTTQFFQATCTSRVAFLDTHDLFKVTDGEPEKKDDPIIMCSPYTK